MNKYEKGHLYKTKAKDYIVEKGLVSIEKNFTGYRDEIEII